MNVKPTNAVPFEVTQTLQARRKHAWPSLNHSNFSSWFDEASLSGPGMLQLDHAIVVCLGELEEDRRSGVSVRELLRSEKEDGNHRP